MENRHLFAVEEVSAVPLAHIYDGALSKAERPQKAAHRSRVEVGFAAQDCVNIDMFSLWCMCGHVTHVYDHAAVADNPSNKMQKFNISSGIIALLLCKEPRCSSTIY